MRRASRADERAAVVAWIRDLRDRETRRNAGDPGTVLARRLSNAEFDYTIRDLTGVDIRPTREFPVDPADEAGFDNSGESLAMSPALLKKYLAAVRLVADHAVLTPDGSPCAASGRRRHRPRSYCVQRIIDFYERHKVDLADYFQAAWKRTGAAGRRGPGPDRRRRGAEPQVPVVVWSALTDDGPEAGPLAVVRKSGASCRRKRPAARTGCERMRDLVVRLRRRSNPRWASRTSRGYPTAASRSCCGATASWRAGIAAIREMFSLISASWPISSRTRAWRSCSRRPRPTTRPGGGCAGLERFCAVFPDAFVVSDRAPYFDPNAPGQGRPLTAGFHLMQGYFRDDGPLCDLVLDDGGRRELDRLWDELNFVTLAPMRQYRDFIFFERAEPPRFARGRVRLRPFRGQGRDFPGEDRPHGRGVPGQGAQAGAGDERWRRSRPISRAFRRKFAGSSRSGWPPSRSSSTRWCSSRSGPIAGPCRAPSGTICWRFIADSAARTTSTTRRRCATRSSVC